ncbi:MAG: hypothetical protein PHP59_08075 [Methanofollis sp.]|uniref:hypothetical protein n=1 Tax=Methanofollis sp. TaxID=2052835 RepID=UPI00260CA45E|nr:hypothetical protein [Methanofollis sp.]MDD4255317.1 hypothetical protein [Methanofollis sp.]
MEIPFRWLDENNVSIDRNNVDHLNCSESALLWAALTVGAPSPVAFTQNILDTPAFALQKWFAILSVVDFQNNEIKLRDSYHTLDPSEKGVLSYWTGMTFAKLAADQVLRAPWMAHARLMKVSGALQVTPSNTKSLPDLVGYGDDPVLGEGWHVIEAKGLQRTAWSSLRQQYKNQIGVVESVHGETKITKNYCITYLRSSFSVDLHDPEDVAKESIKIDVTPRGIQKFYYKPFYEFFKDSAKDSDTSKTKKFLYKKILCDPSCKKCCCIGIAKDVFEQVREWELGEDTKSDNRTNLLKNIDVSKMKNDEFFREGDIYIGSDGIFVKIMVNDS